MAEEIELKSYGFEKATTKVASISFRLDIEHKERLESLFESLNVHPRKNRISDKMLMFIDHVDALVKKPPRASTSVEVTERPPEIQKVSSIVTKSVSSETVGKVVMEASTNVGEIVKGEGKRDQIPSENEQETEGEYKARTSPIVKKPQKSMPTNLYCPNDSEPIEDKKCDECHKRDFKMHEDCYNKRNKIRLGTATDDEISLFAPSKIKDLAEAPETEVKTDCLRNLKSIDARNQWVHCSQCKTNFADLYGKCMNPKGLVAAASTTSQTSISIRWQSCASSFTSAMLTDR